MADAERSFMASCPRGLADLLALELAGLGAQDMRERGTGVAFRGSLESAYRACLWSRTANRLFLQIGSFEAADAEEFYAGVRRTDWTAHIGPQATLACDFSGQHPTITHSHFGALKLKDGICDGLRAWAGYRPDVERERPDVRVHAHANGGQITLSLDLSGESLHRRGYRGSGGEAPLKENVAAGVLLRAGWPALAAAGAPFLDPLCGSGTFVIEAALIALDIAPGLSREYFGFLGWRGHDAALWQRLLAEARGRREAAAAVATTAEPAATAEAAATAAEAATATAARTPVLPLRGIDRDAAAIGAAVSNARRAGVAERVQFRLGLLADAAPLPPGQAGGLLCTNPPYGVRLEDREAARAAHHELGVVLRERFVGWEAAVLTGAPELGLELGIRARRTHVLWNGAIECRLLRLSVAAGAFREVGRKRSGLTADAERSASAGARMFANRLAKNFKRLTAWAQDKGIFDLRLYDADMPEYALAIDRYRIFAPAGQQVAEGSGAGAGLQVHARLQGGQQQAGQDLEDWLYVQEYEAPGDIDAEAVKRRRAEALSVLTEVTGVPGARIRVRLRRKQSAGGQYRKLQSQALFHLTQESGVKLWVNFDDYLDTGLFLDHRLTRERIGGAAAGRRFLNLFCYTGAATVHAAAGGARASTSVDLSRTYLQWARRNLEVNGLPREPHELVQADCREWLETAARRGERYDLIFLDPPTFSNSKRMQGVLDVSRDHGLLIDACAGLLGSGGLLLFSTNAQRFKLDEPLQQRYAVTDISKATLPLDYARNPRIHRCFEIRAR